MRSTNAVVAHNIKKARSVVHMPNSHHIAFTGVECTIRIDNVVLKELVNTMHGPNWIRRLAVTLDGLHLVMAANDHTARVWLVASGAEVRTLQHKGIVYSVAVSPDNQLIVTSTGYPDYAMYVWRMADGSLVRTWHTTFSEESVAVSPDGLHVVSGSCDKTARVWLLADGALQREIKHPGWVFSVAVTPDSQHIITSCYDGNVRLFLLATGALLRELSGHTGAVWQVAVSASGRHVVSCSNDKTVRVWSLADAQTPLVLTGHTDTVRRVAFHPNSKQVASVSDDGTVRLWRVCEWTDRDHQLFGPEFKALVFFLMCIKSRLDDDSKSEEYNCLLPRLPMAVWLQVFASLVYLFVIFF